MFLKPVCRKNKGWCIVRLVLNIDKRREKEGKNISNNSGSCISIN